MEWSIEDLDQIEPWEWPPSARKLILKTLKDRKATDEERAKAAWMGGDLTVLDEDLAAALLAALEDTSEPEEVRANAAIAFGPALEVGFMEVVDGEFEDPEMVSIPVQTFTRIREVLHRVYEEPTGPTLVRRRALEAAVRAPDDWQLEAIRQAYASDDKEWRLTAVFAMKYVRGLNSEILDALKKNEDEEIFFHAVEAAGANELQEAWPRIAQVLSDPKTDKTLLLAAIEAAGNYDLQLTRDLLLPLSDSQDEEISEAASEAMSMAESRATFEGDDEEFASDDEEDEEKE